MHSCQLVESAHRLPTDNYASHNFHLPFISYLRSASATSPTIDRDLAEILSIVSDGR